MKRRELLRHLRRQGCEPVREGANHTVWWNPATRSTSTVGRHSEIPEPLVFKICKDLGVTKP